MTEEQRKVYVVNRSAHDYGAAKKYGKLVFVTHGRQNFFSVTQHARLWMDVLKDSHPDDCIILASLNILCAIGAAIFAAMHGRVNFLLYSSPREPSKRGEKGKYIMRELSLAELLKAEGVVPSWLQEYTIPENTGE